MDTRFSAFARTKPRRWALRRAGATLLAQDESKPTASEPTRRTAKSTYNTSFEHVSNENASVSRKLRLKVPLESGRGLHPRVAARINEKFQPRHRARPILHSVSHPEGPNRLGSTDLDQAEAAASLAGSEDVEARRRNVLQMAAAHMPAMYGLAEAESGRPAPVPSQQRGLRAQLNLHPVVDINTEHGRMMFGPDKSAQDPKYVPKLMQETGYSRRQLFELFMQFKALCAMSPTPSGIDRDTFRRGIPVLLAEDHGFVERVYDLLDEDGSGTIEWDEFITAMAKLDKGTRRQRASFLFDAYDLDGGQTLDTDELLSMLLLSLHIKKEDASKQLLEFLENVTEKILSDVDPEHGGELARSKILDYVDAHPELEDVAKIFGRAMIPTSGFSEMQRLLRHSEGKERIHRFAAAMSDSNTAMAPSASLFDTRRPSFRFGDHITIVADQRLKQGRSAAFQHPIEQQAPSAVSAGGGLNLQKCSISLQQESRPAVVSRRDSKASVISRRDSKSQVSVASMVSMASGARSKASSRGMGSRKMSRVQQLAASDPRRRATDRMLSQFKGHPTNVSLRDVMRRGSKASLAPSPGSRALYSRASSSLDSGEACSRSGSPYLAGESKDSTGSRSPSPTGFTGTNAPASLTSPIALDALADVIIEDEGDSASDSDSTEVGRY